MNGLMLTRRPGESILIGKDIIVTVMQVSGSQVRVNIQAPPSVIIMRDELVARSDKGSP